MVIRRSWREEARLAPKQNQFLDALVSQPAATVLYGGSGYSGKTMALIAASVFLNGQLRSLGFPGQRGFIGCMQYTQITDRIIPQMEDMVGHLGKITRNDRNGLHFAFKDKSMGVICLRNLRDPVQRKGSGFAYVLVDELTEIPRSYFGDMMYFRLQRGSRKLPYMPFGSATNPDGIGHSWVKKLWVRRDFSGNDEAFNPDHFIFVPARPDDNPAFDEDAFNAATAGLPEHVRKARRTGSWDAPEGMRWPMLEEKTHLFDFRQSFPSGIPSGWHIVMGVDYGLRDPYCALWIAIDSDKNLWVLREDYRTGLTADQQAQAIVKLTFENERVRELYLDPAMWQKFPAHLGQTDLSAYVLYEDELRKDQRFGPIISGNNNLVSGFAHLDRYFNQTNDYPNIFIEVGCKNLWMELTGATFDRRPGVINSQEQMDPRLPDHAIAALRYAAHTYVYGPSQQTKPVTAEESHLIKLQELQEKEIEDFKRRVQINRF